MRIAVAGASGFIGRALVGQLVDDGHDVVALARRDPELPGATCYAVDVGDQELLGTLIAGCDAAFYLVHSLATKDFRARDRWFAESFGRVAADTGLRRIIYLGGLGDQPRSEHLASRQEVGVALGSCGVPVVELRAAVVLGSGSVPFEILRYLTERLPFMVCPRWVRTPIQPIALCDVVAYLTGALHVEPRIYEVGGADVTTYRDMIAAYAKVRGLRTRWIVDVPYLTPHLSSYWVDLVTPVDQQVSHALIESLATEVVVRTRERTEQAFGIRPLGLTESIAAALDGQRESIDHMVMDLPPGLHEGVYAVRTEIPCDLEAAGLDADLAQVGGSYQWYGSAFAWRVRAALGRLVGERWQLDRPAALSPGTPVDWWTIVSRVPGSLVLRATRWFPGEAWLGWRAVDGQLVQVGALRPRGLTGFLYWMVLAPLHRRIFRTSASTRLRSARASTTGVDATAFPNR